MTGAAPSVAASPFRQPKAVYAVAFACVVSFMGIGLVDPILPAISEDLEATPAQVTLLFTSYLVITAVSMLITGWVSSRIGAKRTLIAGLATIVVFSALAGASDSIGGIVGFRAGWGVGNALFIATSLAVIVASASGGFVGAIVLYETALGLGIAAGPLVGGLLGHISWRGPFYGVAVLMAVALLATVVLLEPTPKPTRKTSLSEPLRALRHRGLAIMSLTALCYNWAFFTVLGYAPFPMGLNEIQLGLVFTAWGALVAVFAVFVAPWLQHRLGIARTLYLNLLLFAVVVLVIAIWTTRPPVLVVAVIATGVFIGVNNTVTTQAVMTIAPVDRPIASAAYGFVRFVGGGLAPYAAGKLVEATTIHVPFYLGVVALLIGMAILSTARRELAESERLQAASVPAVGDTDELELRPVAYDGIVEHPGAGSIVVAIDGTPASDQVAAVAGRLATAFDRRVYVVHAQESAISSGGAIAVEDPTAGEAAVRRQLDRLAAMGIPVEGHVLRGAGDHRAVGRLIGQHARRVDARAVVVGRSRHTGMPALMDASASQELWRQASCHVVIVDPDEAAGVDSGHVTYGQVAVDADPGPGRGITGQRLGA